jgi:ubiquinone/menaquinone biosynthesis C-methylase UbiE
MSVAIQKKPYKGLGMEGFLARWYAKTTGKDLAELRRLAESLASRLTPGSRILEVAPGPGYLAIELARLGDYRVVGLDISKTFVRLATENAHKAGVQVAFHHGDAAAMPFDAESFDLVVCRAAFKNFSLPVEALKEMWRVLRPGGKALIIDLRKDASVADIDAAISDMQVGWWNSLVIKWTFKHMLLKRAYTQEQMQHMASQTPFGICDIKVDRIGLQVWLQK